MLGTKPVGVYSSILGTALCVSSDSIKWVTFSDWHPICSVETVKLFTGWKNEAKHEFIFPYFLMAKKNLACLSEFAEYEKGF